MTDLLALAERQERVYGEPLTVEERMQTANALREAHAMKAQFARFHHPECPHRHDVLIGNCCENNDAALTGMQHWREVERLRALLPLLASAWYYGGWKAETHNEREMQKILEAEGWWPIVDEDAFIARINGALSHPKSIATRGD